MTESTRKEQLGDIRQIYLGAESYKSQSSLSSSQRLYNCYAENTLGTSPIQTPAIFGTPGYDLWKDLGISGQIYGYTTMNNFLYVVCGLNVYRVNVNKAATLIGTLATAPNKVMMTENGLQVTILTATGAAYYYTESTGVFAQITDSNYPLSSSICTIDGYTIVSKQESGEFYVSSNRETQTWSALDFATAEAISDNIVRVASFNRDLYIFGSNSVEIWQSTGIGTPPFQRISGVFTQQGTIARDSVVVDINGIFFLGNDNICYVMNGYQAIRISTFGIEYEISKISYTADAIAFIYTQAGHKFYCLTFPSANKTFVYDITTDLWHERGSFNPSGSAQIAWSCIYGINFNNEILVNGIDAGKIFSLKLDVYTENGQEILTEIITPLVLEKYNQFIVNNLILIMDSGVGIDEPDNGSNPKIMFSFSIDGAKTWIDRRSGLIGKIGAYRQRINWMNLGNAREFIFKFQITDPVKRSILAAYVQTTDGGF